MSALILPVLLLFFFPPSPLLLGSLLLFLAFFSMETSDPPKGLIDAEIQTHLLTRVLNEKTAAW